MWGGSRQEGVCIFPESGAALGSSFSTSLVPPSGCPRPGSGLDQAWIRLGSEVTWSPGGMHFGYYLVCLLPHEPS